MRVPTIGDKYCCFSSDHDIITTDGWIPIDEVSLNHKVACLIDGHKLEYHNPIDVQKYNYNGNMYVVNSNQVKIKVTPNHRMYVSCRNKKNYYITEAENVYHKRRCYMKDVDNYSPTLTSLPIELKGDNEKITHFVLPQTDEYSEIQLPIDDWLMFLGIWYAEGCCCNNWIVNIAANKQRVKTALIECCSKLGFQITKHHGNRDNYDELNQWTINMKQLAIYMRTLSSGSINKTLPKWVWYLNREQCRILINGMMLGDGHIMKNGTQRYDTSSRLLADDFQRLCLHAGYSANINIKYKAGHTSICKKDGRIGEIFKSTTDAYRLTIIKSQNRPLVNKNIKTTGYDGHDKYEQFNGNVYCCSVPNDGVIYVRRNGYPVWCGN